MIYDIEQPPILNPPPAVIKFADENNVKLLGKEQNIPLYNGKTYKKYKHHIIYPCFTDKNTCTILYKNKSHIRFANYDEEKEIYIDFR